MQISILCIQERQFRDLDFNSNWNIGQIYTRKIQKVSMRFFLFAKKKKKKSFQFHANLKYYILGSQIPFNLIDFDCYCHWFKTANVGKQVVLHPFPPPNPPPTTWGLGMPLAITIKLFREEVQ